MSHYVGDRCDPPHLPSTGQHRHHHGHPDPDAYHWHLHEDHPSNTKHDKDEDTVHVLSIEDGGLVTIQEMETWQPTAFVHGEIEWREVQTPTPTKSDSGATTIW